MYNLRRGLCGLAGIVVAAVAGVGGAAAETHAEGVRAPEFEVDVGWPKPLPHRWLVGQVNGVAVDRHDTIWIVQQPRTLSDDEAGATDAIDDDGNPIVDDEGNPIDELGNPRPYGPIADCCLPAPSIMQFDREGNLLQAWGGPADPGFIGPHAPGTPGCDPAEGCTWPAGEHGIFVDHNDNVWIGGVLEGTGGFPWAATHGWDSQVLKFSNDGTFLLAIGDPGNDHDTSNDTDGASNGTPQLWRAADIQVDPRTNEAYIADGYGNHRVVVVDADSGLYKRHWGAYGESPVDVAAALAQGPYAEDRDAGLTPQHFRNPVHCVRLTRDRRLYVCDRVNDRLQVFTTGGKFLDEMFIRSDTLGEGSVFDLDTSADRRQSCLHNADGINQHVDTIDRRSLELLSSFGRSRRNAGDFHWVHSVATDSDGNIYTGEIDSGKRAQKFVRVAGREGCGARKGNS